MNPSDTHSHVPPGNPGAPRVVDVTHVADPDRPPDLPPPTGEAGGTLSDGRGAAPAPPLVPGYELLGVLGRGAMGEVFKARQVGLNRVVALKVVLSGPYADPTAKTRFLIEAEAAAAVDHPNVVRVYESGEHDGIPYLAMEYLPGGTLGERLKTSGRLPPADAAALLAGVARGVAAAHALGIVHRDLKPANILFAGGDTADGEATTPEFGPVPKVADFGIAKRGGVDLTGTVAVLGTPAYMAPEQARGDAKFVSAAADVWALGVILYECLHGERPFRAPDIDVLLAQIRTADPAVPSTATGVPRELDLICRKCLEKEPKDRYPTAADLVADLERFLRGDPVSVRPLGAGARAVRWARRNPALAGLFAVVALFAAGLGASLVAQYRQAVDRAAFERRAKEDAEKLAADLAALATAEAAAKEQAQELAAANAALATDKAAEAERANQVSGFLTGLFRGNDPLDIFGDTFRMPDWQAQRAKTAGVLLREAADKFKDELRGQPLARAKLLAAVGDSLANLGEFKAADPLLREALDLRRAALPPAHPDVIRAELALGRMRWQVGDMPAALDLFRGALTRQRAAGAPEAETLTTRLYEAVVLSFTDPGAADPIFKEVIAGWERLHGPGYRDTLVARTAYVAVLLDDGRVAEASEVLGKVLGPLQAHPDERFRTLGDAVTAFQVGIGYRRAGLRGPAEDMFRKAVAKGEKVLPADHWVLSLVRFELAGSLAGSGKDADADALYARILADTRRTTGLAHPKLLILAGTVGDRWAARGRVADARALWAEVDAANLAQFGPDSHWRGLLLLQRAEFEAAFGDLPAAAGHAAKAADLVRRGKLYPNKESCQRLIRAGEELARPGLSAAGKATVRELFAAARDFVGRAFGPRTREMAVALSTEGWGLYRTGDRAGGAARLAEAEPLAGLMTGRDDGERRDLWYTLGVVAEAQGRFADAIEYYRKAFAVSRSKGWAQARLDDAWGLVEAHAGAGSFADALPPLADIRRWQVAARAAESEVAWADLALAAVRLGTGDRDAYRSDIRVMLKRFEKSADVNPLARTAWAVGLAADADPDAARAAADRLAAALKQSPRFAWGHRGLALARLRAGDMAAAEAALTAAGSAGQVPFDAALRGLCAASRGDPAAAGVFLKRADEAVAAGRPSEGNPFAFADTNWLDRLLADLLLDELRAALDPHLAPRPRPTGR
ncbi:MAG: hypothetical protein C0501_22655 [Isosphaera sp.]|nr:hypothetical protein [Isosphaera sp.]